MHKTVELVNPWDSLAINREFRVPNTYPNLARWWSDSFSQNLLGHPREFHGST